VTRPLQYAKHKNSRRTYVVLALTWFVSVAISLPIAVGMNYTERRAQTPTLCTFYNAEFLIYSSMTSFYIPCVVIVLLYWRIFRAIHSRTRRRTAAAAAAASGQTLQRKLPDIYVVDNHVNAVATSGAAERPEIEVEESVGVWVGQDGGLATATAAEENEVETVGGATADCVLSLSSGQDSSNSAGGGATKADVAVTAGRGAAAKRRGVSQKKTKTMASRLANDGPLRLSRFTRRGAPETESTANDTSARKARDKNASRRERKATKTLAIVLGISLCTVAIMLLHR